MNAPFRKSSLIIALFLSLNSNVHAFDVDTELTKAAHDKVASTDLGRIDRNSKLYYKIGGSRPLSAPPSHNADLKVGGKLKFGAGYSCGKFDPSASLQNFMNNLKNGVDDAMNTVSQAASSAVAGLPALLLSRNSPDLYELMQTNVFRAEEKLKFNSMSCQEIERQLASGENPYKQWTEMAQGTSLNEESESNPDVNTAMKEVEEDGGDNGVYMPVPGKGVIKAGGKNQDPIRVVDIASTTGYNIMLQRSPTLVTAPTSDLDLSTSMVQTFKTPSEMSKWTKDVLGEQDIYTTKTPSKEPESFPGKGILAKAISEKNDVKSDLIKLVSTTISSDESDGEQDQLREKVSTNNAIITQNLIQKIQKSDPVQQEIIIDGLASEIALNKQIEKAILVRRSLIMGKSEKNISASGVAKKAIDKNIKYLEKEIQQAMFEYRLRKELVSGLVTELYNTSTIAQQSQSGSLNTPEYKAR